MQCYLQVTSDYFRSDPLNSSLAMAGERVLYCLCEAIPMESRGEAISRFEQENQCLTIFESRDCHVVMLRSEGGA